MDDDAVGMLRTDEWEELARASIEVPLPGLLPVLEASLPEGVSLEVWLWDYQRRVVIAVSDGRSVARDQVAGQIETAAGHRPLRLQGEELGMLTVDGVDGATADQLAEGLAPLLAGTVRSSELTTDTVATRRRTRPMSLPAEMQWRILPPSQFLAGGTNLSAAVEPAYDTGGDVYDYALSGSTLFLAVLDARGHGLRAATTSSVATSAMRRARRNGDDLATVANEISISIGAIGAEDEFVSAVLMELDLTSGEGSWLSAGHLPPLVVDDDAVPLELEPALPLGMVLKGQASEPVVRPFRLSPGQTLVLYSDGIIENAAEDDGVAVGEARFHRALLDNLHRAEAGEHAARAIVEDLLAITGPRLRDDATLMVVSRPPSAGAGR